MGDACASYLTDVFGAYGLGLRDFDLRGARVLDVGAGGRYEIGGAFLDAGAAEVVCVDRFVAPPSGDPRIRVIEADVGSGDWAVELAESFDVAVSWVALQQVYDIGVALSAIDRLLRPGGRAIHKLDLTGQSRLLARLAFGHPLAYLAIPEPLYRIGDGGRRPNRSRIGAYRAAFEDLGYAVEIRVEGVLGRDVRGVAGAPWTDADVRRVRRARRFLRRPFRRASDEDLLVTNAMAIATKPTSPGSAPRAALIAGST